MAKTKSADKDSAKRDMSMGYGSIYGTTLYDQDQLVRDAWYEEYGYKPYLYAVYYDHVCVKDESGKLYEVPYELDEYSKVMFAEMSEWQEFYYEKVPVRQWLAVMSVSDSEFGGYAMSWGTPARRDLYGTYFDKQTDFRLDWLDRRPALYEHGLDDAIRREPIGWIRSVEPDDVGLWVEGQYAKRSKYITAIKKMVKAGVLSWSVGSAPNLIDVEKSGHVREWPLIECTMTTVPGEPRMTEVQAIRSAYKHLELKLSLPSDVLASLGIGAGASAKSAILRQANLELAYRHLQLQG